MQVTNKRLKLNYIEQKAGKDVVKSYSYEVAPDITNDNLKAVGESFATLIKEDINGYLVQTTEEI